MGDEKNPRGAFSRFSEMSDNDSELYDDEKRDYQTNMSYVGEHPRYGHENVGYGQFENSDPVHFPESEVTETCYPNTMYGLVFPAISGDNLSGGGYSMSGPDSFIHAGAPATGYQAAQPTHVSRPLGFTAIAAGHMTGGVYSTLNPGVHAHADQPPGAGPSPSQGWQPSPFFSHTSTSHALWDSQPSSQAPTPQPQPVFPSERPHKCNIHSCTYSCDSKKDVDRHCRSVHRKEGDPIYSCGCGKTDVRKDNYLRHLRNCKQEKHGLKYSCRCGAGHSDKAEHKEHIKNCTFGSRPRGRPRGA